MASDLFNHLYEKTCMREHVLLNTALPLARELETNLAVAGVIARELSQAQADFDDKLQEIAVKGRFRTKRVPQICHICHSEHCQLAQPVMSIDMLPTSLLQYLLGGGPPIPHDEAE